MLKLGEKNFAQPRVRIGEWVRTNERFIDGYELLPFTEYLTGAEIATREFDITKFPDLWKSGYDWDKTERLTDMSTYTEIGFPERSNVTYLDKVFVRVNNSLYSCYPNQLASLSSNLLTSNYIYWGMPKTADNRPLMVIGVTDGNQDATLLQSTDGKVWETYLTFPAALMDFDCANGSDRIAAVSSVGANSVYTHGVYEVVVDPDTSQSVINTLPTTGLDSTQEIRKIYMIHDNDSVATSNFNQQLLVVRYNGKEAGKDMFAIFRRDKNLWEGFKIPYEYAPWTNGTELVGEYGAEHLYFGFEKDIWKIHPKTLAMEKVKVISAYNRPQDARGDIVSSSENLSYNASIVVGSHHEYPDIDDIDVNVKRVYLLISTGESLYHYDCHDDTVTIFRDRAKLSTNFNYIFGDNDTQMVWRSDNKVEEFNMIPNVNFKVDAYKVNGVIDTSYRLVARKVPF